MSAVEKRPETADLVRAVNVAFGSRLRQLRRMKDISQSELAARVGISRVTIATIESGKQNTQLHHIFLFARALDLPVERLMPNSEEVKNEQKLIEDPDGERPSSSAVLFLRDARAMLMELKRGLNDQTVDKTRD